MNSIYYGYIAKDDELLKSSSGGAAVFLSQKWIKNGGVVIGVKWESDYRSCFFKWCETTNDLEEIIGTKYISPKFEIVYKNKNYDLFEFISDKLIENNKILFIGLGCYVGALKHYLGKHCITMDSLYTCDLLCHGPALEEVHIKYIDELEKKNKSKLIYLSHRYKMGKWQPKYIYCKFENGKEIIEKFNDSSFGKAFHKYAKPQCTECKFKGRNHEGDLCLGDFWGADETIEGYNDKGMSLIILQTSKGKELLDLLNEKAFFLKQTESEKVLSGNPMYSNSRKNPISYSRFIKLLKKHSLKRAFFEANLKEEMISCVKTVVHIGKK